MPMKYDRNNLIYVGENCTVARSVARQTAGVLGVTDPVHGAEYFERHFNCLGEGQLVDGDLGQIVTTTIKVSLPGGMDLPHVVDVRFHPIR